MSHYSYHGRTKQRIKNGELRQIVQAGEPFALRFIFADGTSRPIRPHRVPEYLEMEQVREKLAGLEASGENNPSSGPDATKNT